MKKLLYILLFLPLFVFGQTIENNRIIFRETFNDEFSVRRNGASSFTDVTFSNGVVTFNGTSSGIVVERSIKGTYSIRLRFKSVSVVSGRYMIDFREAGGGAGFLLFVSTTTIQTGTGTHYVDAVQTSTVSDDIKEIVITGMSIDTWTDFHIGSANNGFGNGAFELDLLEIYNYTLTAEEVSNLYNNRRFRDIGPAGEILNVSAQSGTIIDRWGNTLTNTAVTVFKYGDASIMSFNGSSSAIEATIANTIKTISFWIYTDDLTQSIADFGGGNTITVSGGTITAAWADNIYIDGATATDISANEWFLVTLTDAGIVVTDIDIGKEGANFYKGFMNDVIISEDLFSSTTVSQEFTSHKYYYVK